MNEERKLTPSQKWQLGMMYMTEYVKVLNENQNKIIEANSRDPDMKIYSWDEFWQIYNKLWNAKQFEAVLLHLRMNYLNGFNKGRF